MFRLRSHCWDASVPTKRVYNTISSAASVGNCSQCHHRLCQNDASRGSDWSDNGGLYG
ncbi:hypothetical protein FOPG_15535 [Fusarium oxysporum f. sp. conglutinans race 2 54008]|uniref:Uncharacterized protein n=1 Tax=Fusarium oxysporum f. sp. conglutinans race 2 54008 TaxID=1089457 RepID=X0GYC5_FUSOX|nr:hypothetical protein FOPG_15535 [Fusarium oxysporum f. sp. conglutinans race 2 54008]